MVLNDQGFHKEVCKNKYTAMLMLETGFTNVINYSSTAFYLR